MSLQPLVGFTQGFLSLHLYRKKNDKRQATSEIFFVKSVYRKFSNIDLEKFAQYAIHRISAYTVCKL